MKITQLYCFLETLSDGSEKIPAIEGPNESGDLISCPLIGINREFVSGLISQVLEASKLTGRSIRLVRFTHLEEVEKIK